MLHQTLDQFGPRVDDSLRFVVTSFRVRPHDISGLELNRIEEKLKHALAPRIFKISHRPHKTDTGVVFLGTKRRPAEKCHGPHLADQLAYLGLVPQKVRIYVHDRRFDNLALRVNIIWSRRDRQNDDPETDAVIDENRQLYHRLQGFAWDVTGIHFESPHEPTHIVFDFHGKDGWLVPSRRHELTIDAYGVVRVEQR